jgi:hypothetical protein
MSISPLDTDEMTANTVEVAGVEFVVASDTVPEILTKLQKAPDSWTFEKELGDIM